MFCPIYISDPPRKWCLESSTEFPECRNNLRNKNRICCASCLMHKTVTPLHWQTHNEEYFRIIFWDFGDGLIPISAAGYQGNWFLSSIIVLLSLTVTYTLQQLHGRNRICLCLVCLYGYPWLHVYHIWRMLLRMYIICPGIIGWSTYHKVIDALCIRFLLKDYLNLLRYMGKLNVFLKWKMAL